MGRLLLGIIAALIAASTSAQSESRTVVGQRHPLLADGADAIRAGLYDEGIRLTQLGLESEPVTSSDRAAALSNLCAAYAGKGDADKAIEHCNASIELGGRNWRAYSNRAYAYWLKGMYDEAARDIEVAAQLAPEARQVAQIRGMINERRLAPNVTIEDRR